MAVEAGSVARERRRRGCQRGDYSGPVAVASRRTGGVGGGTPTRHPCRAPHQFRTRRPLDGTREFLAGRDEFTVNIAIVFAGTSSGGLIAAPALGLIWRGVLDRGTERLRLAAGAEAHLASEICAVRARGRPATGFVATVSRSHFEARTDAFLKQLPIAARVSCGSSLKFCRIAEGAVDIYVRLAQTCEWDIAAGHAVVAQPVA